MLILKREAGRLACMAILLSMIAASLTTLVASADPTFTLPNLVPERPYDINVGQPDEPDFQDKVLRFSIAAQNHGLYSLELQAEPNPTATNVSLLAFQCVVWAARVCEERVPSGEFVFHEQHRHWHYDGFARYELRKLDPEGQPDTSEDGLVAGGQKVSFCLEDTNVASGQTPWVNGTDWVMNSAPLYKACTPARQGITSWWEDVYHQGLYGQQIDISDVPDGNYALIVILNPEGRILETTHDDNTSFTRISLLAGGTVVVSE